VKRALLVAGLLVIGLAVAYGYGVTRREADYRAFIDQGDAALVAGDTSAAIEAFSGAIAHNDESMVAYLKRGEAKRRRDEFEGALKDLRRASELDPTSTRPRELLGDVNYAMARYTRAAEHYQAYLALDEQSPRLLYKLGLARYQSGDAAAAIDALRNAIKLDDQFAEAHYLIGLCLREAKQRKDAVAALERAVALAPAMIKAREELADLYKTVGRVDDRTSQLEALLAFDPGPAREIALGLAYAAQGDTGSAVQTLSRTARRHPSYRYTYVALGKVWLDLAQARSDEAALGKALEALQSIAGVIDSSEALTLLGRALLMSSQEELAETTLLRATETLPVEVTAFAYLADVAERRGHDDLARQALLDYHALEAQGGDPRRHGRLALRIATLSLRLNDADTAIEWYQRAATAAPLDAAALVGLADAQFRTGTVEDARTTLSKALAMDPTSATALQLKRRFRRPDL
jgi:tetratricopeptide (TPR) repeat protein